MGRRLEPVCRPQFANITGLQKDAVMASTAVLYCALHAIAFFGSAETGCHVSRVASDSTGGTLDLAEGRSGRPARSQRIVRMVRERESDQAFASTFKATGHRAVRRGCRRP